MDGTFRWQSVVKQPYTIRYHVYITGIHGTSDSCARYSFLRNMFLGLVLSGFG